MDYLTNNPYIVFLMVLTSIVSIRILHRHLIRKIALKVTNKKMSNEH